MDQRFCNDNIIYSTGHDSRKRLRFEEEADYIEKSEHLGYFWDLFYFSFLLFFSSFSSFFVVLVLYQSILELVIDSVIESDELPRFVGNNAGIRHWRLD